MAWALEWRELEQQASLAFNKQEMDLLPMNTATWALISSISSTGLCFLYVRYNLIKLQMVDILDHLI